MVESLSLELPNLQPFVPWVRMVLKYLDLNKNKVSTRSIASQILSFTSFRGVFPCHPPVTRSLPPTTDARAASNDLGREAKGVQAVAPGRRVSTDSRKFQVPVPSTPPPTTSAWAVRYSYWPKNAQNTHPLIVNEYDYA